jgi:hypothetical protein
MGLKDSLLLRDLDKTLAVAGVILSIILVIYLGKEIGRVVYLLTGVLALISCLLWLAIRKSHTFTFHLPESRTQTNIWSICFFGLYTLSVLSVYLRIELYERPTLYFVLTALMAGIIACEIFTSSRRRVVLILIQILLLGVSITWSQLLIFPSLLGVDPWFHSFFTNQIIGSGFIPEEYVYSKLPLFHLMVALASLIAALPYKLAAMVSVSLGQIICNTVFVFLIADCLFKNHRVGLLAALMVIVANHHIFMSYWSIPNAFAAVFIPMCLYLFFFRFRDQSRFSCVILCIIVLTTLILTHTVTAMCMTILLFVTWVAFTVYRTYHTRANNSVSLLAPIGFAIAMFAWWTYAASGKIETLAHLIDWGFSIDAFISTPEELRGYAAVIPLGEQLFNNLGMFLFFAFSFVGIFYMISRRGSSSSFALAWVGMAPLAIGFFSLISGHSVLEHRWWYFAQILLSIPLAIAVYVVGTWKLEKSLRLYGFVFGFVVTLSLLTIMSPPANVDNVLFSPNSHIRYSVTDAELELLETLMDKWDGPIKTDEFFAGSQKFQYPQVSAFCQQVYSSDYLSLRDHIIVIREVTVGRPFKMFTNIYKLDYDLNIELDRQGFSRIYDSNSGSGYRA